MNDTDDVIPFECDDSFNDTVEILKYVASVLYLLPGFVLHLLILKCVLFTERKFFKESSFFNIFVADSIASAWLILTDIFSSRLFLYVPPLCPILGPVFWTPSVILNISYISTIHARFAKPVAQIFMVLNRMSCVLTPTHYSRMWRKLTPVALFLIAFLPFCGSWNVIISRVYVMPSYGGFATSYIKTVQWAGLSLFQSTFILTALIFTIICTSVTLFKLIFLPERIKSAERSLCFTSIFISLAFFLVAATQLCYVFWTAVRAEDWLFIAQFLAFDVLNVGSAVVMVLTNTQLRSSIFSSGKAITSERVFQRSSVSSAQK